MKEKKWQELFDTNKKPQERHKSQVSNRIIGNIGNKTEGKTIIMLTSMHGDESAALIALKEVFEHLGVYKASIKGLFVGLVGNIMALHHGKPFVDQDLNQLWDRATSKKKLKEPSFLQNNNESVELRELLHIIEQLEPFERERFLFVNLTGSMDEPLDYVISNNDILGSYYGNKLEIPVINNIGAIMEGTAIQYFESYLLPAITIVTNRPNFMEMVESIKKNIYHLLRNLNIIDKNFYLSQLDPLTNRLNNAYSDLPKKLEFVYKHQTKYDNHCSIDKRMIPFQKINKGDLVAFNDMGSIAAPYDGYLLFCRSRTADGFYILQ